MRKAKEVKPISWSSDTLFERVLKNKEFLLSIGIKNFPIEQETDDRINFEVIDSDGFFIGNKTFKEAKELVNEENPDLVLVDVDPPAVQMSNFKRMVLRKIRVAQAKTYRKHFKEEFRTVVIRNTIKPQDLANKMIKVVDFVRQYSNITIQIPFDVDDYVDMDRAKVLAKDIEKHLKKEIPGGVIKVENDEDCVTVSIEPDTEREKIIENICNQKELFKSNGVKLEYTKLKNTFDRYKQTYRYDPEVTKRGEQKLDDHFRKYRESYGLASDETD